MSRVLLGVLLLLSFQGCRQQAAPSLPYFVDASLTPRWLTGVEAEAVAPVADFAFTDQHGRLVQGRQLAGRVVVANFIFTRCAGICPSMVRQLKKLQAAFAERDDLVLLSFSVDPGHDDVAVLDGYAQGSGVGPNWHLLTGERDAIYAFARTSLHAESAIPTARGADDFLHTENVYLLDRDQRIRGVYNGTLPLDIQRLIEDATGLIQGG